MGWWWHLAVAPVLERDGVAEAATGWGIVPLQLVCLGGLLPGRVKIVLPWEQWYLPWEQWYWVDAWWQRG